MLAKAVYERGNPTQSIEQKAKKILIETKTLLLRYTFTGCPQGLQSPGTEILKT